MTALFIYLHDEKNPRHTRSWTAASGVRWRGAVVCASLRGPLSLSLCAGEALLEARTQASVALFKLGAHSATLRPECLILHPVRNDIKTGEVDTSKQTWARVLIGRELRHGQAT